MVKSTLHSTGPMTWKLTEYYGSTSKTRVAVLGLAVFGPHDATHSQRRWRNQFMQGQSQEMHQQVINIRTYKYNPSSARSEELYKDKALAK